MVFVPCSDTYQIIDFIIRRRRNIPRSPLCMDLIWQDRSIVMGCVVVSCFRTIQKYQIYYGHSLRLHTVLIMEQFNEHKQIE